MKHLSLLVFLFISMSHSVQAFTLMSTNAGFVGWGTTTPSVTVKVNYSNCGVSNATLDQIIDDAMALWNGVPTAGIKLERGGSSSSTPAQVYALTASDNPVIACDTAFTTTTSSAGSTLGIANVGISSSGVIGSAGIVLNVQSGQSGNITSQSTERITITIAHELGHLLGLGHTSKQGSLMYYSLVSSNLALSQDDMDGLTYLYPRNELGGDKFFGCTSVKDVSGTEGDGSGNGLGTLSFLFFAALILFNYCLHKKSVIKTPAGL